MAFYDALIAKWATLSGTTAQKLATLNALTAAGPTQDVSASAALAYFALNAKLSGLLAYAASPPTNAQAPVVVAAKEFAALFSMPAFTTFQLSNPSILATVQVFLNLLASDAATGITAADATALLALGSTTVSWCKANGYPEAQSGGGGITNVDLTNAGLS
jgi:hypothetical protein